MKKASVGMIMLLLFTLVSFPCLAQKITASTTMRPATGISISITPVYHMGSEDPKKHVWGSPSPGLTANFGELSETSGYTPEGDYWVFYGPDRYFSIDIAWAGGGAPKDGQISFTYDGSTSPEGVSDEGLGDRSVLTFAKTVLTEWPDKTSDTTLGHIGTNGKVKLADLSLLGVTVTDDDILGGWLRVYFGVATGAKGDPEGTKTFGPGDPAGTYSAEFTVTFSAT